MRRVVYVSRLMKGHEVREACQQVRDQEIRRNLELNKPGLVVVGKKKKAAHNGTA